MSNQVSNCIRRSFISLVAPQVERPWVTSPLKVACNKVFYRSTFVKDPHRGKYEVSFLSADEMQKLADYNFTKFLQNFKQAPPK